MSPALFVFVCQVPSFFFLSSQRVWMNVRFCGLSSIFLSPKFDINLFLQHKLDPKDIYNNLSGQSALKQSAYMA